MFFFLNFIVFKINCWCNFPPFCKFYSKNTQRKYPNLHSQKYLSKLNSHLQVYKRSSIHVELTPIAKQYKNIWIMVFRINKALKQPQILENFKCKVSKIIYCESWSSWRYTSSAEFEETIFHLVCKYLKLINFRSFLPTSVWWHRHHRSRYRLLWTEWSWIQLFLWMHRGSWVCGWNECDMFTNWRMVYSTTKLHR